MRGRGGGRTRWPAPVLSLLRAFGIRDAAATARGPAQGKRAARGAGAGLGGGWPGARALPWAAAGWLGYPLRPQHGGGRLLARAVPAAEAGHSVPKQGQSVRTVVRRAGLGVGGPGIGTLQC